MSLALVIVSHRDCRQSSVQKVADAFRHYFMKRRLSVAIYCDDDNSIGAHDDCRVVLRVMEGQERHGRHSQLVSLNNELFVELASYPYDSAPTDHIMKFENGTIESDHRLTQSVFQLVERMLTSKSIVTDMANTNWAHTGSPVAPPTKRRTPTVRFVVMAGVGTLLLYCYYNRRRVRHREHLPSIDDLQPTTSGVISSGATFGGLACGSFFCVLLLLGCTFRWN